MSYKPSLPRFLYDVCSALIVFIIIYFVGTSVHNTYFSILFSILGIIIIMAMIYLPIALYNENRGYFRSILYGYYYFMLLIYFILTTILILTGAFLNI